MCLTLSKGHVNTFYCRAYFHMWFTSVFLVEDFQTFISLSQQELSGIHTEDELTLASVYEQQRLLVKYKTLCIHNL